MSMQEPETMSTETTSTAASIPLALTGQSTLQTLGLEAPNNVACQNGLVYDGKCSSLLQYAFMEQRGSYFTAWAGVMTACALVLLVCVYLPANLINNGQFFKSKYAWIVNYGVTPFITTAAVISCGVMFTSQLMMAYQLRNTVEIQSESKKITQSEQSSNESSDAGLLHERVGIQLPYLEYLLKDNFLLHIVPGAAAVVILIMLSIGKLKCSKVNVGLVAVIMSTLVALLYCCVPVKDATTQQSLVGWQKLKYVYNRPAVWVVVGHAFFTLLAAFAIPYFVVGSSCALPAPNSSIASGASGASADTSSSGQAVVPPSLAGGSHPSFPKLHFVYPTR